MENQLIQKPCLVKTAQGFSVSYNNKLLYSKYAPSKAILAAIEKLSILPGTIFLCCSPVLEYGLLELEYKLPENCLILAAEVDPELIAFTNRYRKENPDLYSGLTKTVFLSAEELLQLPVILNTPDYITKEGFSIPKPGTYRRIITLDMSAGVQLHQEFYQQLAQASTNAIMTFWANRITLTKFGRLYSKNYFTNLRNLIFSTPISNFIQKVSKPIIVFGAGESFIDGINFIGNNREKYTVLCVDTALLPLLKHKIEPDGVFIEEAQFIISKAFLGTKKYNFHIFAGMSSLPLISQFFPKKRISYFTTLYTDSKFINSNETQDFLPQKNNPFGSVGLTAVYYGLKFRKDNSIPVYVCGLDFSYSAGLTHTKETMAHNNQLMNASRFNLNNYNAAFNASSIKITDKKGKNFYTSRAMLNYANLFNSIFESTENLYDLGQSGIPLTIPAAIDSPVFEANSEEIKIIPYDSTIIEKINAYIENEKAALSQLRDILSGQTSLSKEDATVQIKKIAEPREYLYLHFPDGYRFSMEISFLKRIRSEIDYFLKVLK